MTLTREQIREKLQPRTGVITVEGWGDVRIRSQPESLRSRRTATIGSDPKTTDRLRIFLVIDQVVDDDGQPMFSAEDIEWMEGADGHRFEELAGEIARWNNENDDPNATGASPE